MITQIKMFNDSYSANEWLSKHPEYMIRDIKHSVTDNYVSIMIIYDKSEQPMVNWSCERTTDKNIEYKGDGYSV